MTISMLVHGTSQILIDFVQSEEPRSVVKLVRAFMVRVLLVTVVVVFNQSIDRIKPKLMVAQLTFSRAFIITILPESVITSFSCFRLLRLSKQIYEIHSFFFQEI